eukprot:CAMPEP_0183819050 /NCGR_PEP_ID=MMETSP0803_2-20130417/63393_1 /TAXON_ID=195967 /ORGANISM="Crustomastix stigmata, Strain CCMP3273" /LENGTH=150 /DNA_ID=CAMNT_0026063935 /DNA_START=104 /DNA_END=553 /DNA_ORIENTATION=-
MMRRGAVSVARSAPCSEAARRALLRLPAALGSQLRLRHRPVDVLVYVHLLLEPRELLLRVEGTPGRLLAHGVPEVLLCYLGVFQVLPALHQRREPDVAARHEAHQGQAEANAFWDDVRRAAMARGGGKQQQGVLGEPAGGRHRAATGAAA